MNLTAERLRYLLNYDPASGVFTWKKPTNKRIRVGDMSGSVSDKGYITISVDGKNYLAHRLAFLWMEGAVPPNEVDHINGNRADNRWSNLRHATHSENMGNRSVLATSKSGIRGVGWDKKTGKWRAQIKLDGRTHSLGYFSTVEEAQAIYNFAAGLVFGQFAAHFSRGAPA